MRRLARRAPDGEAVVLGGDLDPAGAQVLDRMVGAAVAEGQLEGLQADRPAEQLVAEADADDGPLADQLAHGVDDVVERRGVAGPVGEEDEVRIAREHLVGRGRARKQRQPAIPLAELPNDRELDPGVDADHVGAVAVAARPAPPGSPCAPGRRPPSAARPRLAPGPRPRSARPGRSRRASPRGRGCGAPAPACRPRRSPGPRSRAASRASRPRRRRRPRRSCASRMITPRAWTRSDSIAAAATP